jgi:hypothetical protein
MIETLIQKLSQLNSYYYDIVYKTKTQLVACEVCNIHKKFTVKPSNEQAREDNLKMLSKYIKRLFVLSNIPVTESMVSSAIFTYNNLLYKHHRCCIIMKLLSDIKYVLACVVIAIRGCNIAVETDKCVKELHHVDPHENFNEVIYEVCKLLEIFLY